MSYARNLFHDSASLLLATALCVLVNVIGMRLYVRVHCVPKLHQELSAQTINLLNQAEGNIELISFFERSSPLADPVKTLLTDFTDAAKSIPGTAIKLSLIDPDRHIAEATIIARRYAAQPNSLIVDTGTDFTVLTSEMLLLPSSDSHDASLRFVGESAVVGAIWKASRAERPTIYFLSGHGELDPTQYDMLTGYSIIARYLQQQGYAVQSLSLSTPTDSIPDNCSLLIIAGPRTYLGAPSIDRLGAYLATGGRIFFLLDAATDSGLSSLFEDWGIQTVSVERTVSIKDQTENTAAYLPHPITQTLGRAEITLMRSLRFTAIIPPARGTAIADRPRVVPLIAASGAEQVPGAPVAPTTALALAAERGSTSPEEGIPLSRIVVIGGARFVANGMLEAGYRTNRDFFLNAVNWLANREPSLEIAYASLNVFKSPLTASRWARAALCIAFLPAAGILVAGGLYLLHRHRKLKAKN